MRIKASRKQNDGSCGDGKYRVQIHSRRAALVSEFCLDKKANNVADLDEAEELLRKTLSPRDFASTTVTLIGDEGEIDQNTVQFNPRAT